MDPNRASTRLSVNNWRISRPLPAPTATRMAFFRSRSRPAPVTDRQARCVATRLTGKAFLFPYFGGMPLVQLRRQRPQFFLGRFGSQAGLHSAPHLAATALYG